MLACVSRGRPRLGSAYYTECRALPLNEVHGVLGVCCSFVFNILLGIGPMRTRGKLL